MPGLIRQLELDRPPGLLLDHGRAIPHPAADGYVIDLHRDKIAAAQLAVDREIEQREIALATFKLEPNPEQPVMILSEPGVGYVLECPVS